LRPALSRWTPRNHAIVVIPHVAAKHRVCDDDLFGHKVELDARSREVLPVPELRRIFLLAIRDD
jgi:hypothetical protein